LGWGAPPEPTDQNPGAHKRRVYGHGGGVLALLGEDQAGQWGGFPRAARLFIPWARGAQAGPCLTKIDLAPWWLRGRRWPAPRRVMVVDTLYAKAQVAAWVRASGPCVLVSRLRSPAALSLPPPPPRQPRRGRPRGRGAPRRAPQLYRRRAQRRPLRGRVSGKSVTLTAFVGGVIPSPRLGNKRIRVVLFPHRSGHKLNLGFATDPTMAPARRLELEAARFTIEAIFDELQTTGGFAACRPRAFPALKRHATLCLVAYRLLRVLSVTGQGAAAIEADPWWCPAGPPSVTRLRRAVFKALRISTRLHAEPKETENPSFKEAA